MWAIMEKFLLNICLLKILEIFKISKKIIIENQDELEKIKFQINPVIFISGHFNNFELMAMHIEKSGIDLSCNL